MSPLKFDTVMNDKVCLRLMHPIRNLDSQSGDSNNQLEAMEKFEQIILMPEFSKRSKKLRKQTRYDGIEHACHSRQLTVITSAI